MLRRIKIHQLEMMQLRGKVIPKEELPILDMNDLSFNQYLANASNRRPLNNIYYDNNNKNPLAVYYIKSTEGPSVKSDEFDSEFIELIKQDNVKDVILITLNIIKSIVSKLAEYPAYNITVFNHSELIINPTKHIYAEKIIRKLTDAEKKTHGIRPENMRQLCYDDPIVKFYGFVPGDIILCSTETPDPKALVGRYTNTKIIGVGSIKNL